MNTLLCNITKINFCKDTHNSRHTQTEKSTIGIYKKTKMFETKRPGNHSRDRIVELQLLNLTKSEKNECPNLPFGPPCLRRSSEVSPT